MLKTGPRVVLKTGPSFHCFSQRLIVFFVCKKKTQIVAIGAKVGFLQNCQDVKNEVFKENLHFLLLFFLLQKEKQKKQKKNKMEKGPKSL